MEGNLKYDTVTGDSALYIMRNKYFNAVQSRLTTALMIISF